MSLEEMILSHPREFINGFSLYYPIDDYLLSQYPDVWNWKLLSRNTSIKWSEELIEKFEDRWHWEYRGISNNESLPWSASLLRKFSNRWSWYHLGWQSKIVNDRSMFELCVHHWGEWHQKHLFSGYAFMPTLTGDSIEWAESVFENWKNLNWSLFSNYNGFPWTEAFIKKYEERLDWEALSENTALPWSEGFIETFRGRWNWHNLSYNKFVPWTVEMLEKFHEHIHWDSLSATSYRHWDLEMLIYFKEQLRWVRPQHNEAGDLVDVDGLIENPSLVWTPILFHACCDIILSQFHKLIEEERDVSYGYVVLDENEYWTVHLDGKRFTSEFVKLLIDKETITSKHYIDWEQFALEFNQWNTLDVNTFNYCLAKVDIDLLAGNESFPWHNHYHLLERITSKSDHTGSSGWDRLSYNKGLMITSEILERYSAHWNWKQLSHNPTLTIALVKQFEQYWDHKAIAQNSAVAVALLRDTPENWNAWWRENRDPPFGSLANFQALLCLDEQPPILTNKLFYELDNVLHKLTNKPKKRYREDFMNALKLGDFSTLIPALTHDQYLPLLEEVNEEVISRKWTISLVEQLASKAYSLLKSKNYQQSITLYKLVLQMELDSYQKVNDLSPYCNALYVL